MKRRLVAVCLMLAGLAAACPATEEPADFDDLALAARQSGRSQTALGRQLRASGLTDPAVAERVEGALETFLAGFTPDSRRTFPGWRVVDVGRADVSGAVVRCKAGGVVLADFPLAADVTVEVRHGEVVGLPRIQVELAARDLSNLSTFVDYCPPGGVVTVDVLPSDYEDAAAGFVSMGFQPLTGSASGVLRAISPRGAQGLLTINAAREYGVWTAGILRATPAGSLEYQQRVTIRNGSFPRFFRDTVESKVNDTVSTRFRGSVEQIAAAIPGRFAFFIEQAGLQHGRVVVVGRGSRR
jgi:hypothetical protein